MYYFIRSCFGPVPLEFRPNPPCLVPPRSNILRCGGTVIPLAFAVRSTPPLRVVSQASCLSIRRAEGWRAANQGEHTLHPDAVPVRCPAEKGVVYLPGRDGFPCPPPLHLSYFLLFIYYSCNGAYPPSPPQSNRSLRLPREPLLRPLLSSGSTSRGIPEAG